MAVIQISKMQVRRGQTAQTNFPQLSSGEFGWSIDQQQLFIGNGSVAEGAPAVGNTEIITEHNVNNFFLLANNYTYGTSLLTPVPGVENRSVQAKLDDVVNLNDFIRVDENNVTTVTNYTGIIQTAINYASSIGRPLVFPEGLFVISDTIEIPSNTEIRGAGIGKTVIQNQSTTSTFQTIDSLGRLFEDMQGDDSSPKNVRINGVTFVSSLTNSGPIMQIDCLSDSMIEQCEFVGDQNFIGPSTSTMATAISLRSIGIYPANATSNLAIRNCKFYRLGAGIVSDYDVANIEVSDNTFKNLNEGIVLAKNTLPGVFPPRHIRISKNNFSHINYQAIYAGSTSTQFATDINSLDNYFYDVGNNNRGDAPQFQLTEVIRFSSYGNHSEGDTFERLEKMINLGTRADYIAPVNTSTTRAKSIISGPAVIKSKSPQVFNFTSGIGTGNPILGFPLNSFTYGLTQPGQIITIDYTLLRGSVVRRGTVEVIVNGTTTTIRDDYTFSGTDTDPVFFTASVLPGPTNLVIVYTNTAGSSGTIFYTFSVRQ
jgi:hypothetical protein